MKKLKLNLEQLHNECDVINPSELNSIKGGDWITDFFNNHNTGVYTPADWNTPTIAVGGTSFDINAFSDLVFHNSGSSGSTNNEFDHSFMMVCTGAYPDSYYTGGDSGSGSSYGDYGGYDEYGGYGGYNDWDPTSYNPYDSGAASDDNYGRAAANGMTAPTMYAMSGNDDSYLNSLIQSGDAEPVGLRQFIAISVGASGSGTNTAEIQAAASTMIARMNEAGTSLYDPNWLKKISYGGNTATNFTETNGNNVDYKAIMHSKSSLQHSTNCGVQDALAVAQGNWNVDYSNPGGRAADTGLYYFNKANSPCSYTENPGAYVITLKAGGSIFYRPK